MDPVVVSLKDLTEDALENARRSNNSSEVSRIILNLNSEKFTDYETLVRSIKEHVDNLDPFEPRTIVQYILENLRPEYRRLLDPVNIILSSKKKKRRNSLLCFVRGRT